ncbi:MAG: DUF1326 domain-containing protein [Acidobacteria bacterium]|nr:DUF1326 domain-containing protein [Acidobacteriota bacterium]
MVTVRLALALLAAAALAGQSPETLSGEYLEGRSNHVYGCYCEWSGESQTGGQEAVLAWSIRSGAWGGVPLAGVRMAAVIVAETTLSQGSPPRKSILILDSAALPARRKAAEALLRERFGALIGRVLEVRTLPVEIAVADDAATLKVGSLLHLALRRARLPEDALQGARLWYDPFVPLTESALAVTMENSYGGRGFDTTWTRSEPGVTGYFGRFEFRPEEGRVPIS